MRLPRSVRAAVALVAGLGAVHAAPVDLGTEEQREAGAALYGKYCAQCHGEAGRGDGPAAGRVLPVPRDFTAAKFKLRTTPSGALPTDGDIKRSIRNGLPYTSMPAWPDFSEQQLQNLVYHLKTFSEDFADPDKIAEPIAIPEPPPSTPESIERGREVYAELGCAQCHGELGRGDGTSAPTLKDDRGNHLRPADMTMRWQFRGGPTRRDIFRTFSTGLNGTPMPSFYDSIEEQDRWALVDYIYSLGEGDEPGYDNLLVVPFVARPIDLDLDGDLFAGAPEARFPLVGQIMEPGRDFYPSTTSLRVRAVYNGQEIAFLLQWNDMRAETSGSNGPALQVPPWEEQTHHERGSAGPAEEAGGGGFWGEEAGGEEAGGEEAEGEEAAGGDFWGAEARQEEQGGDFWGEEEAAGQAAAGPDTEYSDAVALQFPETMPTGIRKPYFIFGDAQNPVDLWFLDLTRDAPRQYVGRGSGLLEESAGDLIEVASRYEQGQWSVIFKRSLRSTAGISFEPERYVPIAFSVWDGFNRERGNKRALSAWFHLYVEPSEKVSSIGPMLRAALLVLLVEMGVIWILRRRFAGRGAGAEDVAEKPIAEGSTAG